MDPLTILIGLTMVVGLMGTLLPILPGLALIWAAAFVYGVLAGFGGPGLLAMMLITGGVAVGAWIGVRIPKRRTADAGVGLGAQLFAVGLAIVGFFVIPVIGAFIGFVGGILVAQWRQTRDLSEAWVATKAAIASMFHAAAAQFGVGVAMITVWLVWVAVG